MYRAAWLVCVGVASALLRAPSAPVRPAACGARRPRSTAGTAALFDVAFAETVASAAALPAVFVGAGSFLLNGEGEDEGEDEAGAEGDGEVDLYRDTLLRYAGYANEVGEAFKPLVPGWVVPASYGVAITYVFADTLDKTKKAYEGTKYEETALTTCALIEGLDALIWQLAASVALPGYTIHQVVAIAVASLDASGLSGDPVADAIPTAIGLATIPFIVKPLDELAEVGMDSTLRKLWSPYLESCEVNYD